jgi:hypothetical protein
MSYEAKRGLFFIKIAKKHLRKNADLVAESEYSPLDLYQFYSTNS